MGNEWGEGLPPAGCNVEALADGDWCKAEWLKRHNGQHAVFFICSRTLGWADNIRPIRSEEDKAAEEMAKVIARALGVASPDWWDVSKSIYAAIRDGEIPGVKLVGEDYE